MLRRLLAVPTAVVGTVALTLGIAQPATASTPEPKRTAKPPSQDAAPRALASAATAASAPTEYVVVDGDTVSGIAERFGLSTAEVLALNGLSWSTLIFPGQRLLLRSGGTPHEPPAGTPTEIRRHVVATGDTVSGIAAANGLDVDAVLSANGLGRDSLIFPGQQIVLPDDAAPVDPATEAPAHEASAPPEASAPAPPAADAPAPAVPAPDPTVPDASVPDAIVWGPPEVTELTDEMRGNARIVVDVGRSLGVPERGILIALVAAAQESGLRNVQYGDTDSLGLFQQRPSQGWGTAAEVLDPVRAATAFYGGAANPNPGRTRGLLDIAGWEQLAVGDAAQAVQISAHPGAYARWEPVAQAWLAELG